MWQSMLFKKKKQTVLTNFYYFFVQFILEHFFLSWVVIALEERLCTSYILSNFNTTTLHIGPLFLLPAANLISLQIVAMRRSANHFYSPELCSQKIH